MLRMHYRRLVADRSARRDGSVANVYALLGVRDMDICTFFAYYISPQGRNGDSFLNIVLFLNVYNTFTFIDI